MRTARYFPFVTYIASLIIATLARAAPFPQDDDQVTLAFNDVAVAECIPIFTRWAGKPVEPIELVALGRTKFSLSHETPVDRKTALDLVVLALADKGIAFIDRPDRVILGPADAAALKEKCAAPSFRILVFSRTAGFRHGSIPTGIAAIEKLGVENGFAVMATEESSVFDDIYLKHFDAIVFLSTTGDVLDDKQQAAFQRYVRRGGGYVGIHAASDTEYDWPWYGKLVGSYFKSHPRIQPAEIVVSDRRHPSTKHLPERWQRTDEWYNFTDNPRGKVHVLAALDESTYEGGGMPADHPTAWCHEFDGGRSWYTGGGHTHESFSEPLFMQHVLGGILWAAGKAAGQARGDAGATIDTHYEKIILDSSVTDPMELAIAPDGRVLFVERGGVVKIWKPDTRNTVTAGFIDVFTELEDGLLGITLDPSFPDTGWFYVYYSPAGDEPKNVLSRLTLKGNRFDPHSEIVMLEVTTQRQECCHSGGSLTFDGDGNLYVSTGDNTSPFASDGYTPIDEREGRSPFDAQKSSASTHDLRGKILRITPQPDGTYTIPPGNLFPPDGSGGRPEIYAMGCRNPFRIAVDPRRGWLYWGDVGPDAGSPRDQRGPAGHDEFNQARAAGNFGWPYFTGANKAYHDFDFQTKAAGPAFDPARPVNTSVNSTGVTTLPPAQPAWIPYVYGPTPDFPVLGTGGRCAMAGPVHYHDDDGENPHRLPAYFDDTVFIYEWARNWIMEVKLDAYGDILAINPFLSSFDFIRPMDMEIGPDGRLYMIEWGTGFGGGNADSLVTRIDYFEGGHRPPLAVAAAGVTSGPVPLTVRFSSTGSVTRGGGPITHAWDFDGDGVPDSRDNAPTFTYESPGDFQAQLVVTDQRGRTGVANIAIAAGNTGPEVTIGWPPPGAVFEFGEDIEFAVTVADVEDEPLDPGRVVVQPSLGHDTHAHPMHEYRGTGGVFETPADDGHGPEADLFLVLSARYRDQGAATGVDPLTARDEIILQPRRKQAEYFSRSHEVRIEKADDTGTNGGGGQAVVFESQAFTTDAWVAYEPVSLYGVNSVTLRVASGDGGVIDLRSGAPGGDLIARAVIEPSGRHELAAGAHPIRIEYFERGGGAGLILRMTGEGRPKATVPAEMLAHGDDHEPGLEATYYTLDGGASMPEFATLEPHETGVVAEIDFASTSDAFAGSGLSDDVAAVFEGYILIPAAGYYGFSLESDDGSRLFLAGEMIIDNDGLHGMREKSTGLTWTDLTVPVVDPGGTHTLFLVYHPKSGDAGTLKLNWLHFHGPGLTPVARPARSPVSGPVDAKTAGF